MQSGTGVLIFFQQSKHDFEISDLMEAVCKIKSEFNTYIGQNREIENNKKLGR